MKLIFVFVIFIVMALAAPQGPQDKDAVVVKSQLDNIGVDGYKLPPEASDEPIVVNGHISYVDADGMTQTITYIADENGFQPQGGHIPTK